MPYPETSLIRILRGAETRGTGFVVSQTMAVTCAHVIEKMGRKPGDRILVQFHAGGEQREASVLERYWSPSAPAKPEDRAEDIAILQIDIGNMGLPEAVAPAKLGSTRGSIFHSTEVRGFAKLPGKHGFATALGNTRGFEQYRDNQKILQIRAEPILQGMSGAPVYDLITDRVIGMVSEYIENKPLEYAIPSESIVALCPLIPIYPPQSIEEYLTAIREFTSTLPYVSLGNDLKLDQVYVEQLVRERSASSPIEHRSIPLFDVLTKNSRIILVGGAGSGKSTLVRQLIGKMNGIRLPIVLSLRALSEKEGSLETKLQGEIENELGMLLSRKLPEEFLKDWSDQTGLSWVIALDGLDEVINDIERNDLMFELSHAPWPDGTTLILTTRPGNDISKLKNFRVFDLLPFEQSQISEFAEKVFPPTDDVEFLRKLQATRLGEIAATPLVLTLAAVVFQKNREFGFRRSQLYEAFVNILLEQDAISSRKIRVQLQESLGTTFGDEVFTSRRKILECIALSLQKGRSAIDALAAFLQEPPFSRNRRMAHDAARTIVDVMGRQRNDLLISSGSAIEFIQPTFREYLAATALAQEYRKQNPKTWERPIVDCLANKWSEVLAFYLTRISDVSDFGIDGEDVTPLVKRILKVTLGDMTLLAKMYPMRFRAEREANAGRMRWEEFDKLDTLVKTSPLRSEHRLRWAALSIIDKPNLSEKLVHRIIHDLAQQVPSLRDFDLFLMQDENPISTLALLRQYPEAIECLVRLAQQILAECARMSLHGKRNTCPICVKIAQTLEQLGFTVEAVAIWREMAAYEVDGWWAADALADLGYREEAANIVVVLARERQGTEDAIDIARKLAGWGLPEQGTSVLRERIEKEGIEREFQSLVAKTFEELGSNESVASYQSIVNDQQISILEREQAAEQLIRVANLDVLRNLALDDSIERRIRVIVAKGIGQQGHREEAGIILYSLVRDSEIEEWVAAKATSVLGELERSTELRAILEDDSLSPWVRQFAQAALSKLNLAESPDLVQEWIAMAKNQSMPAWARIEAISFLERIGNPKLLFEFEKIAASDVDSLVARCAHEATERLRTNQVD